MYLTKLTITKNRDIKTQVPFSQHFIFDNNTVFKSYPVKNKNVFQASFNRLRHLFDGIEYLLWLKHNKYLAEKLKDWKYGYFEFTEYDIETSLHESKKYIAIGIPSSAHAQKKVEEYSGEVIYCSQEFIEELERKIDDDRLFFASVETVFNKNRNKEELITKKTWFQILENVYEYDVKCPACSHNFRIEHTGLVGTVPLSHDKCPHCSKKIAFYDLCEQEDDEYEKEYEKVEITRTNIITTTNLIEEYDEGKYAPQPCLFFSS